jgi:hypothetical protein
MTGTFAQVVAATWQALDAVASRAAEPQARVAKHWEDPSRLTWFGAAADHQALHASWSFGRLRDVPLVGGARHTVGVFMVTPSAFPEVDGVALRAALDGLVPAGVDGATKVFLQRVAAQLAAADGLLRLERERGVEVFLFARPDALHTAANTPRWPEHARDRVAGALLQMDDAFRARCEATWAHPATELLTAARGG